MRVTILAKKAHDISDGMKAVFEERGHLVTIRRQRDLTIDRRFLDTDLVVLKSKRLCFLYAGLYARSRGIRVVPDPEVAYRVRDRILCHDSMRRAGVPVPAYYLGYPAVLARTLPPEAYPLVSKGRMEASSTSVLMIDGPEALLEHSADRPVYLQRFISGEHFLVNFVESAARVFRKEMVGTRRIALREIAMTAGVADVLTRFRLGTGLAVGDLDLVRESESGTYWSVDPGSFPSFELWPDAAPLLVDAILREAARPVCPLLSR
jgi:hypothetical protein